MTRERAEAKDTSSLPARDQSRFSLADLVVFIVGGSIATPFCHAAAEAALNEHYVRATVGFGLGLPLAAAAFTFKWWKKHLSTNTKASIARNLQRWWPVVLILLFIYIAGPEIYR